MSAVGVAPRAGRQDISTKTPDTPRVGLRQMLRSASGTAALQAFSNGAALVLALLLARFLGREGYGRYAFSYAWSSFLAVLATLGLDRYLVRGIAVYEVGERWQLMKGLLRRTNQLVLGTSLTIAVAGAAVALQWLAPSLRIPFCIAMLLVPLTALTFLRQGAMQAIGRVVSGQFPEYLIRPLLILAGVIALKLAGGGLLSASSVLAINVVAVAVAFTTGAVLLMRALPPRLAGIAPRYAANEWLRGSLPMMLISGVWMVNSYITILVTGTLKGPSAAGIYSVVQNGGGVIVLFLVAANMPLAPVIARLHAHGDMTTLERTTERVAWTGLLISAPMCVVLALFPGIFLSVFGKGFQLGASALTIVALAQLVNAAAGPAGNVLIMTGHERVAVYAVGLGALVNLVLAIVLVPALGVTGGAIAYGAALVLWNVALVILARSRLGVNVTAFGRLAMRRRLAARDSMP